MAIRRGVVAAVILLAALPSSAEEAMPTPGVARVNAALAAKPLDCAAVEGAYAALGKGGRQPGDVAAVAAGRRSDASCAHAAADGCASALGIESQEIVTWLLRHPEASSAGLSAAASAEDPADGGKPALSCGLTPTSRRIVKGEDAVALVLALRNDTRQRITGHDIVLHLDGRPWRGARGEGFAEPIVGADSPIGSADRLGFDASSQTWEDQRMSESRTVYQKGGKVAPKGLSIEPGALLELSIPMPEGSALADPEAIAIEYVSCRLTLH